MITLACLKHQSKHISLYIYWTLNIEISNLQLEKEKNQNLPSLDVCITKASKNRITTNYQESTDTYYSTNLSY